MLCFIISYIHSRREAAIRFFNPSNDRIEIEGYMVNHTQWGIAASHPPTRLDIESGGAGTFHILFKPIVRGKIFGKLVIRTNLGVCVFNLEGKGIENIYRIVPLNDITMKQSMFFNFVILILYFCILMFCCLRSDQLNTLSSILEGGKE